MGNRPTLLDVVREANQALEQGDKTRAHSCYTIATQLDPSNQELWWQRAETASDPQEATQCLEQILKLDPQNARARDKLLVSRLSTLQEEVKVGTDPSKQKHPLLTRLFGEHTPLSRPRTWVAILFFVFCVICIAAFAWTFVTYGSSLSLAAAPTPVPDTPTLVVLQLPQTWTPVPTKTLAAMPTFTPTPDWKVVRNVTVRSGPGPGYNSLGILPQGSRLNVMGRTADGKYLQVGFAEGKLGWIATEFADMTEVQLGALAVVSGIPTLAPIPRVATRPPPTATPAPYAYSLGRGIEYVADCSKPWKIMGTVYDSQAGYQRVNGVTMRIWAYGQVQGTINTGTANTNMPGYWEWTFNRSSDVVGQVAIVNADGSLRSQPVGYHLTSNCEGAGAVNQMVIDFVGKR